MPCTLFTSTRYLRGGTTHLHLESSSVLVVVPHDIGEESHVVRHPRAPGDGDGLAGEQAVPPHQRQQPGAGEGAQERSHFAELPATGAGLRALCPALASSPPPRRGCGYCPMSQRLSPAPSLLRAANTRKSRARRSALGLRAAGLPAEEGREGERRGKEGRRGRPGPHLPRRASPRCSQRPGSALGSQPRPRKRRPQGRAGSGAGRAAPEPGLPRRRSPDTPGPSPRRPLLPPPPPLLPPRGPAWPWRPRCCRPPSPQLAPSTPP